ncbi:MAG: hypothetical protein AAFX85_18990, partial [Pseudomonadota bacterium]
MSARSLSTQGNGDALVYALFGATLLHGLVILGLSFDDSTPRTPGAQPLKVVLTDPATPSLEEAPDDAEFAAISAQLGSGIPQAEDSGGIVMPASPQETMGETDGDASEEREVAETEVAHESLVSPNPSERAVDAPPDASRQVDVARLSARLQHASPKTAFQRRDRLQAEGPLRELQISVSTRESVVADYVARWKDRVEEV